MSLLFEARTLSIYLANDIGKCSRDHEIQYLVRFPGANKGRNCVKKEDDWTNFSHTDLDIVQKIDIILAEITHWCDL